LVPFLNPSYPTNSVEEAKSHRDMAKPTAERRQIQCRSSTLMISGLAVAWRVLSVTGRHRSRPQLVCVLSASPRKELMTAASGTERSV